MPLSQEPYHFLSKPKCILFFSHFCRFSVLETCPLSADSKEKENCVEVFRSSSVRILFGRDSRSVSRGLLHELEEVLWQIRTIFQFREVPEMTN